MIHVYRFHDKVAVSPPDPDTDGGFSPTVYLNYSEARALARALYKGARSIVEEEYTRSTVGNIEIPATGRR